MPQHNSGAPGRPRALEVVQDRAGTSEVEPGGRLLGALVHEVLAAIPVDRPDLAENFAMYFAARRARQALS